MEENNFLNQIKNDPEIHNTIDGIIGGDILANYNAIIDYKKKELVLETI